MPIIQISVIKGRDEEQLRNLMLKVTETTAAVLECPKENVRILINEVPGNLWGIGGRPAPEVFKFLNF